MTITATEARKTLFPLIERVNEDREPVRISSRSGDAVLVAADEYDALEETAYLLRSPRNAIRLFSSLENSRNDQTVQHELIR